VEKIRHFDSIDAALADCVYVVGYSGRRQAARWARHTPRSAAVDLLEHAQAGKVAIMFGREDHGLPNEALDRSHAICTIPSNPDFGSLNLAQAVAVLGYAWVMGHDAPPPTWLVNSDGPAAQHELAGLIATIDSRLETNGFFNPAPGKTETARWMLRNVLTRPGFTGAEVQFLRGVVRHLVQARRPS
jgi:TrmH family RNA methyltransferase